MFTLEKKLKNGVRVGELKTAHGIIKTPFFMPVGTVGSVKSVSPQELNELGAEIILCNTYHLYLRPGEKEIKKLGGLHKFINWDKPILTDSGGYQVFSLAKNNLKFKISNLKLFENSKLKIKNSKMQGSLVTICEDGVTFKSHLDGSSHFFTPEKVIDIQLDLGVDILMPLDVCPSGTASREEVEESVRLTTEWAKRSKKHFDRRLSNNSENKKNPSNIENCKLKIENCNGRRPLLHGIVQGGLYEDLRRKSAAELIALDFDGYSVGGLAVDLETREMWDIVKLMGEILPENKQRYLMGVGTPDDIIKATRLGMDMFDCVLPTRMARHGSVYRQKISNSKFLISNPFDELRADQIPNSKNEKSKNSPEQEFELINLTNSKFKSDQKVIDDECNCPACVGGSTSLTTAGGAGFSRAYISHLLRSNEILGLRLTTLHNLYQYLELMRNIRQS